MGDNCHKRGWWTKYSETKLIDVENYLLSIVKTTFKTWFVPIGSTVGQDDKIWMIAFNEESKNTPLVMLHGFAAGLGLWCKNFDYIAKDRPVYAIDLLGFGRSSRPNFAKDCEGAEQQWVNALEEWRKQVNLEKFILLGHSFGGYLATSYTINHPERVKHLILADPWGFAEKPKNYTPSLKIRILRFVLFPLFYFNPLAAVRAAGPLGPALVRKMRSDIAKRYEDYLDNPEVITEYIYQCNSQSPTGETAFQTFVEGLAWTKRPMVRRYDSIEKGIPITVMYGEHSWIDSQPGAVLEQQRGSESYVNIGVLPSAGHHIYSDQPAIFNKFVAETCKMCDRGEDQKPGPPPVALLKQQVNSGKVRERVPLGVYFKPLTIDEIEEMLAENPQQEVTAQ